MDQMTKILLLSALGAASNALKHAETKVHDANLKTVLDSLQTALAGAITALATA